MKVPAGRRVPLVIGAAGVILLGGVFGASRLLAAPVKAELRTANVTRSSITQTVAISGSVSASTTTNLSFKTAGEVAGVPVTVGQSVNAGDVLAKLKDTDQRITVQQAQANLNAAQAKYDASLRGDDLRSQQNAVDQSQQSLNRLLTNYAAAKTNLDAIYGVAKADRDSAYDTLLRAESTLSRLQSAFIVARQYNDVRSAAATAATVSSNFALVRAQLDVLDGALRDLEAAQATLRAQIGAADAGHADAQAYALAQTTYSASLGRAQSAIDAVSSPLATAGTNASSIISSLTTASTKGDSTLDPLRTDASALWQGITIAQQQLSLAKSTLGSLTSVVSTITDAVTGTSIVSAQNSLANAKQSLQTTLNSRDSTVQSALASLQSAQASYDNAQNTLANTTLTAPFSGVVTVVNVSVGGVVGTTATAVTLVGAQLALHGTIGEGEVATLKTGQVATIAVDAVGTDKKFTGKVTNVDPVATLSQGVPVYGVDVTLDVADPGIRAGMSGTANVIIASARDVLVVPNLAIRTLSGRRGVQVLQNGEAVDVTTVSFGIANDSVTEVKSGLTEGQAVVLPTVQATRTQGPGGGGQIRVPGGGAVPGR